MNELSMDRYFSMLPYNVFNVFAWIVIKLPVQLVKKIIYIYFFNDGFILTQYIMKKKL